MRGILTAYCACVLFAGVLAATARAETGYVTDILSLGLHRAEDTSDSPFRTLRSGDEFEILSRDGYYARVELPDGTIGYVKANFIVTDKPARAIVDETAVERDRLAAELEDLKAAFAEPAARMELLQQQSSSLRAERDAAASRVEELEAANTALAARQERYRYSLPYSWVAGAALICLVGGILLGLWWVDRQMRRRHGGIRIL